MQKQSSPAVRSFPWLGLSVCALLVAAAGITWGEVDSARRGREAQRVRPPGDWGNTEMFSRDAMQRLRGNRPLPSDGSVPVGPSPPLAGGPAATPAAGNASGIRWSTLISASAVEDEIKMFVNEVESATANPGTFRAGGNRTVRKRFSMAAAMFAIAHDFDGDIRWKDLAASARDAFGRAGNNAKAADTNTFNESRELAAKLADLVRGSRPDFADPAEEFEWPRIAERRPLMSRLEDAFEKGLRPAVANEGEFSRKLDEVKHEAAVIAAIAEIIQQPGYEFHDDSIYQDYTQEMQRQALAIHEAADQRNLEAAQAAMGEISRSCVSCHEGFR